MQGTEIYLHSQKRKVKRSGKEPSSTQEPQQQTAKMDRGDGFNSPHKPEVSKLLSCTVYNHPERKRGEGKKQKNGEMAGRKAERGAERSRTGSVHSFISFVFLRGAFSEVFNSQQSM